MTREDVLKEYAYTRIDTDLVALENEPYTAWDTDAMADEIVRLRSALTHEAQWADAGIDSTAFWQQQRDDLAAQLTAVEAERDALREQLATVTESHEILKAYYNDAVKVGTECCVKMRKAEAILAALREPSEAVVEATAEALYLRGDLSHWCTWDQEIARYKETYYEDALPLIRAAVSAAEADASHGALATQETPRDL